MNKAYRISLTTITHLSRGIYHSLTE